MKGITRNGTVILGSCDIVECRAEIASFERLPDGTLDVEWAGGTEVFWDCQRTKQKHGKDLYLDEDGEEWTEEDFALVDDDWEWPEETKRPAKPAPAGTVWIDHPHFDAPVLANVGSEIAERYPHLEF